MSAKALQLVVLTFEEQQGGQRGWSRVSGRTGGNEVMGFGGEQTTQGLKGHCEDPGFSV